MRRWLHRGSFFTPSIDQADTARRVSRTLETIAGSLDRLLGFVVAVARMEVRGRARRHDLKKFGRRAFREAAGQRLSRDTEKAPTGTRRRR